MKQLLDELHRQVSDELPSDERPATTRKVLGQITAILYALDKRLTALEQSTGISIDPAW